jgi:hypothetical protein
MSIADGTGETDFLFLLTPNNSGGTVISQYLETQTSGYLPPFGNNEGHRIPEVKNHIGPNPWRLDCPFDWPAIKKAYEARCLSEGKTMFIDGSPPNLIRSQEIRRVFPESTRFVLSISNPYMQIASTIFNYKAPESYKIGNICKEWLRKARHVEEIRREHPDMPFLKYEDFVRDPTALNLLLRIPVKTDWKINGKRNTGIRKIVDRSLATISFLYPSEIEEVTSNLLGEIDLLNALGYGLLDPGELSITPQKEASAVAEGKARRLAWEKAGGRPDKIRRIRR